MKVNEKWRAFLVKIGIDAGGTLIKAVYEENGIHYKKYEYDAADEALSWLKRMAPGARIALTGGKAAILKEAFFPGASIIPEFTATCEGAIHLLRQEGCSSKKILLVNMGTGVSWYKIEDGSFERVLGSGIGGGTFVGLGKLLTGEADFHRLAALAAEGSREKADLLVGDIYGDKSWLSESGHTAKQGQMNVSGDVPLDPKLTAANFANQREHASKADKMAALSNMIAETAVLLSTQAAALNQSEKVYFIGSALAGNSTLKQGIMKYSRMTGIHAGFLANGEFSGALGAYLSI